MNHPDADPKVHHGRNVKRFREMFGIKQEAFAFALGDDWSQKKVSRLEEHEIIDERLLEQAARILNIPVEAIKNFDEQAAIDYFNSFYQTDMVEYKHYSCTFNPLDKIIELYEALLKSEREKTTLLKKMLEEKADPNFELA